MKESVSERGVKMLRQSAAELGPQEYNMSACQQESEFVGQ